MNGKLIRGSLIFLLSLFIVGCATGQAKRETPALTTVSIADNSVGLLASGEFTYTVYKPADPFTVYIDLPGVKRGSVPEKIVSDKAGISEVRVTEVQTPALLTRVEIVLVSPSEVEAEYSGKSVLLRIKAKENGASAPSEATAADAIAIKMEEPEEQEEQEAALSAAEEPLAPATEINSIGFEQKNGTVNAFIRGNGSFEPMVFPLKNRIVIDVPGVEMKAPLPEAVLAPVRAVRYGMHKNKVRIVFDLKEAMEFTTESVADTVVISFAVGGGTATSQPTSAPTPEGAAPEVPAVTMVPTPEGAAPEVPAVTMVPTPEGASTTEVPAPEAPVAPEKKLISLDFQNAEVVPILRFLGDVVGYNVVIHPQVSGKITLKLLNVPWDEALDTVLEISGFVKRIDKTNKILTIATPDLFTKLKEDKERLRQAELKVAESVQEIIYLKQIEATEMKNRIEEAKMVNCKLPRIDDRMNALIMFETEECIFKIKEEVAHWDTAEHKVMQVMIEAKMVLVENKYSSSLGINWGGRADSGASILPDNIDGDFSVNKPGAIFGPDVPLDQGGIGIRVGYADSVDVALNLQALELLTKGTTLSNPKVLTMDGMSATITQGTELLFPVTTATGTDIKKEPVALTLKVTPTIKRQDFIQLVVSVDNSSNPTSVGGITAKSTQNINTNARIKDGETLVLGGVYSNTLSEGETTVPFLGKIPIIGWLFKNINKRDDTSELLIFITPKIVK